MDILVTNVWKLIAIHSLLFINLIHKSDKSNYIWSIT